MRDITINQSTKTKIVNPDLFVCLLLEPQHFLRTESCFHFYIFKVCVFRNTLEIWSSMASCSLRNKYEVKQGPFVVANLGKLGENTQMN